MKILSSWCAIIDTFSRSLDTFGSRQSVFDSQQPPLLQLAVGIGISAFRRWLTASSVVCSTLLLVNVSVVCISVNQVSSSTLRTAVEHAGQELARHLSSRINAGCSINTSVSVSFAHCHHVGYEDYYINTLQTHEMPSTKDASGNPFLSFVHQGDVWRCGQLSNLDGIRGLELC